MSGDEGEGLGPFKGRPFAGRIYRRITPAAPLFGFAVLAGPLGVEVQALCSR